MLSLVDRWFDPVRPSQIYRRQDFAILILLLAAGTWLRFWHLGDVGLHGDEDIMGLAARGIVVQGVPALPSGLVYLRAPMHTYLMAGSTLLFGDTEWALRLPSAIVGSVCGLFAFFLGRRFLDPKPNLMFVALVTFLPAMIEISQTARMYVFLVASLLIFGTLLFRWERTRSTSSLLWCLASLLIAVQFHQLAVFAAPMLIFPGLANRSWKQAVQGVTGLVFAVGFSEAFGYFAHQDYPDESERLIIGTESSRSALEMLIQDHLLGTVLTAFAVIAIVVLLGTARVPLRRSLLPATILLSIAAAACAFLHYHIGGIALLFGSILWMRTKGAGSRRLLVMFSAIALMALAQLYYLHGTGEFPGRKIIGAFIGTPSIWPTLRFLAFSPFGAGILVTSMGLAAYRLAQGQKIPVHFLFFGIAVWAPLVAIGLFEWYTATRYTLGPLPFFLLSAVFGATYLLRSTQWRIRPQQHSPRAMAVLGAALVLVIIDPAAAWQTATNSYDEHPDHKGAAEFIRRINRQSSDVVIVEDSIVQSYYLGKVDYRLQSVLGAKSHSVLRDGVLYDQYTDTPVIGSGQEFVAILRKNADRHVYVIGSAQVSEVLMIRNRGNGIAEVLDSNQLEVIHVGRDRATTVWKNRP